MARASIRHFVLMTTSVLALAGCQPGTGPFAGKPKETALAGEAAAKPATSVRLVDRDVEAPEVFQVTDQALWDGRPSLGGVWVASPNAVDPERVIMRNPANGKFVIGALFRRERDNPGPTLQISSDAASALGLLAGQPGKISVTALRREEAPVAAPDAKKPILDAAETVGGKTDDPVAVASGALDKIEGKQKPGTKPDPNAIIAGEIATVPLDGPVAAPKAPAKTAPVPKAPAPAAASAPIKPATPAAPAAASGGLIQIGIFSVEANASRAVSTLTKAGIAADLRKESAQGKTFWSVTARGDASVLAKVKSAGFADAYFLK